MTESIAVGQTLVYTVDWFDGPDGTGNIIPDPGQGSATSDNPSILTASEGAGTQDVTVVGVAAGSANVQAISSTGVVAGSKDSSGAFVPAPVPFLVSAVATIVSGVLRLKAALGAAVRRG